MISSRAHCTVQRVASRKKRPASAHIRSSRFTFFVGSAGRPKFSLTIKGFAYECFCGLRPPEGAGRAAAPHTHTHSFLIESPTDIRLFRPSRANFFAPPHSCNVTHDAQKAARRTNFATDASSPLFLPPIFLFLFLSLLQVARAGETQFDSKSIAVFQHHRYDARPSLAQLLVCAVSLMPRSRTHLPPTPCTIEIQKRTTKAESLCRDSPAQ